jgi:acid phosphatase
MLLKTTRLLCILFLAATASAKEHEKLIFAIDLVRHGDRTALSTIPNAPHHWPLGLGQLTPEGMHERYQLGLSLRKKYIEQTHLLPAQYNPETMYVRSTDYDRTLQSAQSILLGLYPINTGPSLIKGYQPIPIHTISLKQDVDLLYDAEDPIKINKLFKKYVTASPEWIEKNTELQSNYPKWQQATGINIQNLGDLGELSDTLFVYCQHQIPMPNDLSNDDVNKIINAGNWLTTAMFKPKEIGMAGSSHLRNTIANYLQNASEHNNKLKYVLLVAHDSTILSLMSALGAPLKQVPPYSSDLNIALYQDEGNKYAVKVSFNNQPILIPGCEKESCSLSQLMAIIKH